eukprot:559443-Rhodomonas_salina.1
MGSGVLRARRASTDQIPFRVPQVSAALTGATTGFSRRIWWSVATAVGATLALPVEKACAQLGGASVRRCSRCWMRG